MRNNNNGAPPPPGAGSSPHNWDEFDALPREARDMLNYAPISQGTRGAYQVYVVMGIPWELMVPKITALIKQSLSEDRARIWGDPDRPLSIMETKPK